MDTCEFTFLHLNTTITYGELELDSPLVEHNPSLHTKHSSTATEQDYNNITSTFSESLSELISTHFNYEYTNQVDTYKLLISIGSAILFIPALYTNPIFTSGLLLSKFAEDMINTYHNEIIEFTGLETKILLAVNKLNKETRLAFGGIVLGAKLASMFSPGIAAAQADAIDNMYELIKHYVFSESSSQAKLTNFFKSGIHFQLKGMTEGAYKAFGKPEIIFSPELFDPSTNLLLKEYVNIANQRIVGNLLVNYIGLLGQGKQLDIHAIFSLEYLTKAWIKLYCNNDSPYINGIPLILRQIQKFLFKDVQ